MANFRDLNPYRWPGWSVTALSITLALIVLFFFTETRSLSCANVSRKTCLCLNALKLSAQLKSKWKIRFLVSFIHYMPFVYYTCMYAHKAHSYIKYYWPVNVLHAYTGSMHMMSLKVHDTCTSFILVSVAIALCIHNIVGDVIRDSNNTLYLYL